MIGFEYARADSVADALRQMAVSPGAKFVAAAPPRRSDEDGLSNGRQS